MRAYAPLVLLERIVFPGLDLVLDRDDELGVFTGDEDVDISPLSADIQAAQFGTVDFNRAERPQLGWALAQEVHKEGFEEQRALAVGLVGVQEPGEEVGVAYLGVDDAQGVEDVESADAFFELEQFVVIDDELFEGFVVGCLGGLPVGHGEGDCSGYGACW